MASPEASATREHVPDVSVSIVNTNNRDVLLECLASLEEDRLRRSVDVEVVVLDNASEDGSAAAVRERFPTVRLIEQPFRAGFGANHNSVVRATRGRHVYVLNDDTTSDDWGLDELVAYLDARPEVGAIGPRLVYPDGRPQASAWRFPSPLAAAIGSLTLGRAGVVQSRGEVPRPVDWVMGAALLVPRRVLDEVGLFDEEYFIYSEETDLCRRIARAGYEIRYYPSVTVVHHVGHTTVRVPERRINEMWRSRHRYWSLHHSPLGARAAGLLTGWQYAARAALAALLLRLPESRRPVDVRPTDPAEYRLNARNALGVRGPGLRELAEEWNGRAGAAAR
jgi:N-acetylglucosaminyl-diphospho-decaprenol L-rhamnosyltransferase